MKRAVLVVLVVLTVGGAAWIAVPYVQQARSGAALLVVGFYEGVEADEDGTDVLAGADIVVGEMDRPVDLALLAQKPIAWRVTVPEGSRLGRIFLGGPGASRSLVAMNGVLQLDRVQYLPAEGTYVPVGHGMRDVLRELPPLVGSDGVEGFVGGYRPNAGPNLIEIGSGGPDVLSDDPLMGKTVRLPGVEQLTFNAPVKYEPATYNAYGERVASSDAIASRVRVHIPEKGAYYAIYRGTVTMIDDETGRLIGELPLPLAGGDTRYRPPVRPMALIYDGVSDTLFMGGRGGESGVYAYDFAAEEWSVYALMADTEVMDILLDADRERIFVLYRSVLDHVAMAAVYSDKTKVVIFDEPKERFAGLSDFTDPRRSTQASPHLLAVSDEWTVLGLAEHYFKREMTGYDYAPRRMWAVSSGGDTVALTYYD